MEWFWIHALTGDRYEWKHTDQLPIYADFTNKTFLLQFVEYKRRCLIASNMMEMLFSPSAPSNMQYDQDMPSWASDPLVLRIGNDITHKIVFMEFAGTVLEFFSCCDITELPAHGDAPPKSYRMTTQFDAINAMLTGDSPALWLTRLRDIQERARVFEVSINSYVSLENIGVDTRKWIWKNYSVSQGGSRWEEVIDFDKTALDYKFQSGFGSIYSDVYSYAEPRPYRIIRRIANPSLNLDFSYINPPKISLAWYHGTDIGGELPTTDMGWTPPATGRLGLIEVIENCSFDVPTLVLHPSTIGPDDQIFRDYVPEPYQPYAEGDKSWSIGILNHGGLLPSPSRVYSAFSQV